MALPQQKEIACLQFPPRVLQYPLFVKGVRICFTRWRKPLSSAVFWNCIWTGIAWTRQCGSSIEDFGKG